MTAVEAPWWDDAPAVLVGGGPSLRGFDFGRLKGVGHVLGINQSMFDSPCEAGVTIDHLFISNNVEQLRVFAASRPLYLITGAHAGLPVIYGAVYLNSEDRLGLSSNPSVIHRGSTSGYAALGIAVVKRARRIVLLGFDYGVQPDAHHYHDCYSWYSKASSQSWGAWARKYPWAAADCSRRGIEVINASPASVLTCFKKTTIEEALA
jgi:hypothetical protein